MILVDTSVWIEYLRNRPLYKQILRHCLEIGDIATTGTIFGELLQGAKNQKEAEGLAAARRTGARVWSRDKKLLALLKKEEKFNAKI